MMSELPPTSVLAKALAILNAFTVDDRDLGFGELMRRTGLAKGTLHRVAADLVASGLLRKDATRYRLSTQLVALGMRASTELSLIEVATPFLEDLYEHIHETVHLGVQEGHDVVYIAKIGGHRQAVSPSRIGGRMPMHCTALGKVLLANAGEKTQASVIAAGLPRRAPRTITNARVLAAQLAAIAENGIAFEHEESAVGIVCVAAPIIDSDGTVIAAVSVTGPATRFTPADHRASVRAAAAGISMTLSRRNELRD